MVATQNTFKYKEFTMKKNIPFLIWFSIVFTFGVFAATPPPPPVTLAPVGSSPNSSGGSVINQVLTLQPADATHPGAVSTGAQTLAGQKTFSASPLVPDGTNLLRFVITTQTSVTVSPGDVYSDTRGFNYTVLTGGTGVTTITVNSPSGAPNQYFERWAKVSGNSGSTTPFFITYYVDNVTPSLAFANDSTSGIVRFGANDWGLVFNGQTVFEAKTATVAGIPGTDISIGARQAATVDADGVFSVTGNYVDYAAFTFSNANITSPSTGAVALICDGQNGFQCTTLENFASNTENDPYLQGVGALFAGPQNPSGLIVGSENNCYDFVLSTAVNLFQESIYSDSNDTTFKVENFDQSLTSADQRLCTTASTFSLNPSQSSGTLTCVSGGCSGNLTYNSWTPEAFVAFTAGSRYHQNEVLRLTNAGISTNQAVSITGGSGTSNPAIQFNGANAGIAYAGPYEVSIVSNGRKAIDVNATGFGGYPNVGINTAASASTSVPLQAYAGVSGTGVNANAQYIFGNQSNSASSAVSLYLLNGHGTVGASGLTNAAYDSADAYWGGSTLLFADQFSTNLIIATQGTNGILFNVGSTTDSTTERLSITPSIVQVHNSAHFDANSTTVNNVADPASAQDAMTKHYADNHYLATANPLQLTTLQVADGSSTTPSLGFTNETNTGFARIASGDVGLYVGGNLAYEQLGFGNTSAANYYANRNGEAVFSFSNLSTGANSVTTLFVGDGPPSGPNALVMKNYAYASTPTYLAGGSVIESTQFQSGLIISADASAGFMALNVGGGVTPPTAATERVRITPTIVMIEELVQLVVQGSGVTPSCSADGVVAITHAHIMCVCNGSSWVKTSDGSTACTF